MTRKASHRKVVTLVAAAAVAGSALAMGGVANAAVGKTGTASPNVGVRAGSAVTITGTNLTEVTAAGKVVTGTATCATGTGTAIATTAYHVVNAKKMTVSLPAGPAPVTGSTTTAVKLCFPGAGGSWMTVPYTYAEQPAATAALSPAAGPTTGGQKVTLAADSGFPFRKETKVVTVNGVAAKDVKVAKDGSSISFVTPPGAAGAVNVAVKTPGFADVTKTAGYTYERAIKVSPAVIPTSGNTTLTITGRGFTADYASNLQVFVGPTVLCGTPRLVSDTEITCVAAGAVSDPVSVTVGSGTGLIAASTNKNVVSSTSTLTFANY